jgi:hypothetical protein
MKRAAFETASRKAFPPGRQVTSSAPHDRLLIQTQRLFAKSANCGLGLLV